MHSIQHIAIIMDGNGRWAGERNLPRFKGHQAGVDRVREIVKACGEHRVAVLSLFALSVENFVRRPKVEVNLLVKLFSEQLHRQIEKLDANNVRFLVIGDRSVLPRRLQAAILAAEIKTKDNSGLKLNIAINYSGRWDLVQAAKAMLVDSNTGDLQAEDITEETLNRYCLLSDAPEPDLLIRTGGDQRISNFFLWQLAYTELYFCKTHWPDFDAEQLQMALDCFYDRQRRYGKTSAQVSEEAHA